MDDDRLKCVIILDNSLPIGLLANTACVLGMGLAHAAPNIMGKPLTDGGGVVHAGITTTPVPTLAADGDEVAKIADAARARHDELRLIDVTDAAQSTKNYEAYEEKLKASVPEELRYLGVAIFGPQKAVNSLTGRLPMLR